MILLLIAAGCALAGCSEEDSLAEQIAGRIRSCGADKATIHTLAGSGYTVFKENVEFDIEVPFLVYYETIETYKEMEEPHYILLDDCCHIYRSPQGGAVHLYFDRRLN